MGNLYTIHMKNEYRIGMPSLEDFAYLQKLIRSCLESEVNVDCTKTKYISPAFATLFGSLPHFGNFYGKRVKITYNKLKGKSYISDIGIDKYYNNVSSFRISKKAVPFSSLDWKMYERNSREGIDAILNQLPVELGEEDQGMLFSIIGEIFNNAKDHSGFQQNPNTRVYYCGHWNTHRDTYIVSIYDTGVGVSKNVSNYLNKEVCDRDALEWAFGDGNSTQNTEELDFSRGIGLNSLERFIKANKGTLYVGSGNAVRIVQDGKASLKILKNHIQGTIYIFTIKVNKEHKFQI